MSDAITQDWKVLDVREGKTEPNPHGGEFQKFYVDFEGSPDTYWRRKKGDTPKVGQSYYGTISEGQYGPIFKKEKLPEGHQPPSGSSDYQRSTEVRSGDRDASISRQVALKILAPSINEAAALTPAIKATCIEIEEFIANAGKSAEETVKEAFPEAEEQPAKASSGATNAKADDDIPF